jgi:eukaryotic-like serine/threonine-protein kinase
LRLIIIFRSVFSNKPERLKQFQGTKMSDRIGHFEIVSQLAQSSTAIVYKALDTQNQQTVALKVIRLEGMKDRAALVQRVMEESDQAKPLSSHNIAALYGVGEEDDRLLAATEYVQGNSVATTLARNDGFSIWDLQDIARQVCHAIDHAQVHKVIHHSLEPEKIMVQWDGMVKVLGFGISTMSAGAAESSSVPEVLHYASPEQLRGEPGDHRSALFSLGAVLYEMATEQKAFTGDTTDQVRTAILEGTPPLPHRLKANLNPALSNLIMKALSKSADERYQSGQELVRDLEQCNASAKSTPLVTIPAPSKTKAHVAVAAAAGTSSIATPTSSPVAPKMRASSAPATTGEPPAKPGFTVDPMMAEDDDNPAAAARRSFSEMSELPPLKEIYVPAPPPPPAADEACEPLPQVVLQKSAPEKAKVQVREAAQKAVSEIRNTPPKLYLYALGGAVVLITLIVGGMALHNYLEDRDQGGTSSAPPAAEPQTAPAVKSPQPAAQPPPSQAEAARTEAQPSAQTDLASPAPERQMPTAPDKSSSSRGRKTKSRAAAAAAVPAQLSVSSNPVGVQIAFDGNALCVTPCTLTGIAPGQHVVSATKTGYSSENRTIALSAGANSSLSIDLNQQVAKLSVASTPAGAVILIDGKDTGKLTPAQFALDRSGAHSVVLRRYGYLEETSSVSTEAGQTSTVSLILRPLGSTDEIRGAGGRFKKVFGGGDTAGMGIVSIKTQPKGAQIMVNNRVLDKTAPFDFYLNPGTYVVDISMSGYRGVHRVINVEQREKVAIEETLPPE